MSSHIGKELQRLRVTKGLSLDALQRTAGVTRDTINRIENGRRTPHPSTLRAIVRGLRLRPEETSDPRLVEAMRDEGSGPAEGTSNRPADRLKELLDYVDTLDGKTRQDFVAAVLAVLAVAGQSAAPAARESTGKHGR